MGARGRKRSEGYTFLFSIHFHITRASIEGKRKAHWEHFVANSKELKQHYTASRRFPWVSHLCMCRPPASNVSRFKLFFERAGQGRRRAASGRARRRAQEGRARPHPAPSCSQTSSKRNAGFRRAIEGRGLWSFKILKGEPGTGTYIAPGCTHDVCRARPQQAACHCRGSPARSPDLLGVSSEEWSKLHATEALALGSLHRPLRPWHFLLFSVSPPPALFVSATTHYCPSLLLRLRAPEGPCIVSPCCSSVPPLIIVDRSFSFSYELM